MADELDSLECPSRQRESFRDRSVQNDISFCEFHVILKWTGASGGTNVPGRKINPSLMQEHWGQDGKDRSSISIKRIVGMIEVCDIRKPHNGLWPQIPMGWWCNDTCSAYLLGLF